MKVKNNKWCRNRHKVAYAILRPIVGFVVRMMYGFKPKKYKLDKKKGYFILSNHQALLDPIFLALSFNKPIYFVATDNLFTHKHISRILRYFLNPIPKRKAAIDATCLKTCLKVAKEGGSVGLFVEGNRAYNDFQFYIDPSITKLIKKMGLSLVLYNLKGGYGVDPRWGNKKRKGKFVGEVKRIIEAEELENISNEELYDIVCNDLKVIDSDSNELYKSKQRAEYLERQLFVCPKCNKTQTLYSKDDKIYCKECGLEAEYLENLHIKVNDEDIKFDKLFDWYRYQLEYIKNCQITEENIFEDEEVEVYYSNYNQPRVLITKGKLILTKDELKCNDCIIKIKDIQSSSAIGGFKFIATTEENNYLIIGNPRFNPIKYVLMFNVLEGPIKDKGGDKYYDLNIN